MFSVKGVIQTMGSKRTLNIWVVTILSLSFLLIGLFLHLSVGSTIMNIHTIFNAIFQIDQSRETTIIQTLRLPRTILTVMVGAALAVAGALMQAITRNALASPEIFGVNAGASLAVASATLLFATLSPSMTVYAAFFGALLGGLTVYVFASGRKMTHVKLALAGTAIHFFFSSITQAIVILNERATDVLYWLVGSLNGKDWTHVQVASPWIIIGLAIAFLLSRSFSILSLGESMASSLGERVQLIRLIGGLLVIMLAGSSVAVVGPISFIGLIVPHITRKLVGPDYSRVIPISALLGATLLLYADILSHFIVYPYESPVGIVTALIGASFFLYLVRKERLIKQ